MSDLEIQNENDLGKIRSKHPSSHEGVSLAKLTVYSLFWLEQWGLRRSLESVAVLNWRLFPHDFSMVNFPQYPDALRTNRSLMQGQPKYGNWLTGSATKGYRLNERGRAIAEELTTVLGPPETADGKVSGPPQVIDKSLRKPTVRGLEPTHETARVRESEIYRRWKEGALVAADVIHLHALLKVFDHTPVKVRKKRFEEIAKAAADAGDEEVSEFMQSMAETYPHLFSS